MSLSKLNLPRLVRRTSAPQLVLNVLISFGATVLIVRVFLELTGYPRLGNSTLHIAHLLYGGIALTAACLLMLIYGSPTAHRIGSVLTGIGLGLFFDEVGKFITSNNDYFFRPAAPIIYVVCLVITLIIFLLRRRGRYFSDQELMVDALEHAELLFEGEQSEHRRRHINTDLEHIAHSVKDPDHVKLAQAIQEFVNSEAAKPGHSKLLLLAGRVEQWGLRRFIQRQNLLTVILLVILAMNSLGSLIAFSVSAIVPVASPELAREIQRLYISTGLREFSPFSLTINGIDLLLNMVTAAVTLYGIVLFVTGRKFHGLFWVQAALILDLCVVNVFTFYVEQFSAALWTLANIAVLLYVRAYQHQLRQAQIHKQHIAASTKAAALASQSADDGTRQTISSNV
ncbi:MAG: hypothetical protein M1434_03945 [Chloroflexi bacterium]|nr:hypothetical protein [Chloroflexota bacterium]MCL5273883.1 hypothetical protein [Chloroflexota bacterium]